MNRTHNVNNGIKTARKAQWEREQAAQRAAQAQANKAAHAAVLASLKG